MQKLDARWASHSIWINAWHSNGGLRGRMKQITLYRVTAVWICMGFCGTNFEILPNSLTSFFNRINISSLQTQFICYTQHTMICSWFNFGFGFTFPFHRVQSGGLIHAATKHWSSDLFMSNAMQLSGMWWPFISFSIRSRKGQKAHYRLNWLNTKKISLDFIPVSL